MSTSHDPGRNADAAQGPAGDIEVITHDEDGELDEWTFVPCALPDDERMTTWITIDRETVVDLTARR